MALYDKASLVLIPSGTKESKVFSQKPTNGDGDFTFSRASAATRVNSDGLIEKETQNQITYSNTFSETAWSKYLISLTSGQSGYDGTSDAWLLERSGAFGNVYRNVSNSGVFTWSVYAKAGSYDFLCLRFRNTSNAYRSAFFDLSNGTLGSVDSNMIKHSIEDVGSGWYRCQIAFNDSGINQVMIYPSDVNNGIGNSGTGNIYIQDAQLEQGLVAQPYIETTTAAVYEGITDNIPRLDYTDASCPSLLLEGQRTNIAINSEYFDASSWVKQNCTITSNYAISPEGVNNASRIVSSGTFYLYQLFTFTNAVEYTLSFYVKSNGSGNDSFRLYAEGNSTTKTATSEWVRHEYTFTGQGTSKDFGLRDVGGLSLDILIWGAMVEQSSYATSYIPTYGASVTRLAEPNQLGKTDLISDGFFSSTELTWFIDINLFEKDGGGSVAPRLVNSSNNQIFIGLNETLGGNLNIRHKDGTTAANTSGVSFDENGQRFKILVKVSGTTGEAFINGSSMGTFTTLAASNYDEFDDVAANAYDLRQMLMLPTALTDAECIDLTTI